MSSQGEDPVKILVVGQFELRTSGEHYQKHVIAAHRADSYDKKPSRFRSSVAQVGPGWLGKREKDLDDLSVRLSPGAADGPPIQGLVENLPHDVKSEQAGIGLAALGNQAKLNTENTSWQRQQQIRSWK